MKKITLVFFMVLLHKSGWGQNQYHDIIEPRLVFSTHKKASMDMGGIVVLKKDTLYGQFNNNVDLSYLDLLIENEEFYKYYRKIVFQYSQRQYLLQWSVPIKIYIDQKFPKSIVEKFKAFYSQIKGVKNLNISFVNKIKDANYHIKLTENQINSYGEDYEFYSDTERENSIYTGSIYSLIIDKNYKFYGGTLHLNVERLKDKNRALNQLKQMFFMSLGNFMPDFSSKNQNSLNAKNYLPQDSISELDLKLLRVHYSTIYEQPVNQQSFIRLINLRKR